MIHLSIDLETYSDVNLKKAGLYRYVQSPAFEILLFAYSFDGAPTQVIDMAQGEEIPMEVIHALTDPQCLKHAYNAAFEWYCLSKYMGAQLPPAQWRDTMLHGLYAGYTAGLDATGRSLGIPEDKQKLTTGKALIRYFCVPCKPTKAIQSSVPFLNRTMSAGMDFGRFCTSPGCSSHRFFFLEFFSSSTPSRQPSR